MVQVPCLAIARARAPGEVEPHRWAAAARPGVDSLVRIERKPIAENSEASLTDREHH